MTEYPTLSQLILEGQPGDYFHDMPTGPDRSISTYVLRKSFVVEEDYAVHDKGSTVGYFDQLTTRHHGKSELYGRPSYMYVTTVGEHEAATEQNSVFVRHLFSMGTPVDVIDSAPAKRYGRKRMLDLHDANLADRRFPSLTYK